MTLDRDHRPSLIPETESRLLGLKGKVVIVTGAAHGIGAATAELLNRVGAEVALCDRDPCQAPASAHAEQLDVRDAGAVDRFVDNVIERHGRVDGLVNNAGGTFGARFNDVSAKGEAALIAENFTQVTHFIRKVEPAMSVGGSIVNVTSIEAHRAAPGFAIYAAMKAGLENLTRTLALELAPRAIRVNAVAPDALPSEGEKALGEQFANVDLPWRPAPTPPLGRVGSPSDAAGAVLYLLSDLAAFVTGTTVHVDGGNHAAGGWWRAATATATATATGQAT